MKIDSTANHCHDATRAHTVAGLAIVLIGWIATIIFIDPRGNFPLNDDWDFAIATWNFARTGSFQFTEFTAVSLRAQVLWGAAWTRLLGESFEVLRLSTLVLSAALIAMVYHVLGYARIPLVGRVIATAAFAFNPVFMWAACTYHTEVPFVFASACALYLFLRAFNEDRAVLLFAACALVVVSWFVRQTGVVSLLAPLALLLLLRERVTTRWRLFVATICAFFVLFLLLLVLRPEWISGAPSEFANHYKMWTESSFRLPQRMAIAYHYTFFNFQNSALFFLPLTLAMLMMGFRRVRWEIAVLIAVIALFVYRAWELVSSGHPMPYFAVPWCCDIMNGNVFVNWGLGQQTLSDVWNMGRPHPFGLGHLPRVAITYVTALLGAFLLWRVILTAIRDRRIFPLLTVGMALAGTVALFASGVYVDRYSFDSAWSLGLFAAALIPWDRRLSRVIAIVALVAVAAFSALSLQEYFAWNRARWEAFHTLRSQGVPLDAIDGGSEALSFYERSALDHLAGRKFIMAAKPRPYVLTFGPVGGFEVIGRHEFVGWFGWHRGAVYVLRRDGESGV